MSFDLVLVGGGLQNALIALAVLDRHPDARLVLLEADRALGGNHTWSFHAGDLSPRMASVADALVEHRWPAYRVIFPTAERTIPRAYATVPSAHLARVVSERFARAPSARLALGELVTEVRAGEVRLASGEIVGARLVIDARGPSAAARAIGYQKFVGLELELDAPWPESLPVVMDARMRQDDGFRFMYALPLTAHRVLLEDTCYSDRSDLDDAGSVDRIRAYLAARGRAIRAVVRAERGVLPLPDRAVRPTSRPGLLTGGYRGGWFHPTTGYSFPAAARLAQAVAEAYPSAPTPMTLARLARDHGAQAQFFVLLNRLLFRAVAAAERWRVLARFHELPVETIERFYAMRVTAADRARILVGRPPRGVSLRAALRELSVGGMR